MASAFTFANGFFGSVTSTGSSSTTSGVGFVGAYTTATVAAGANNNVLPNGAGWPGTLANPYGRVDFTGALADFNVTGLVAALDGQILILRNITNFIMTLNDQNAGSLAANRLAIGDGTGANDLIIPPGISVSAEYYAGTINRLVINS